MRGLGRVGIDPGADPHDHDGDVVEPPAEVGQMNEIAAGVAGVEMSGEGPELVVGHGPGKAVGAEQEHVGEVDLERALEVHLDFGLGPEATRDDVLGHGDVGLLGRQVVPADELPDKTMIERELVDPALPDAVDARVSHVGDERPFRAEAGATSRSSPCPGSRGWPRPGCGSAR